MSERGKAVADVRLLLAQATARLRAAGVGSPRVDAELLLSALLGVSRTRLLTMAQIPAGEADTYAHWVERRAAREPLQHITGRAPFRNLDLAVGPGVFVPRPETELLVDAVLPRLRELAAPLVLDLCAGSGALGLAILDEVPSARVIAVEGCADAAQWLTRNAAGTRLEIVRGDVRDTQLLAAYRGSADVVVANPPYVPAATVVEPEVAADPAQAVFAGPDGLELIPAVVARAAEVLRAGGTFALEHDETHAPAVAELVTSDGRFDPVTGHHDLSGRPRYLVARRVDAHR